MWMDDLGWNWVVGLEWVCVERRLYEDLSVRDFFEIAHLIKTTRSLFTVVIRINSVQPYSRRFIRRTLMIPNPQEKISFFCRFIAYSLVGTRMKKISDFQNTSSQSSYREAYKRSLEILRYLLGSSDEGE